MSDPLAHRFWIHNTTKEEVRLLDVVYNPFTETKSVFFDKTAEAPRLGCLMLKENEFLESFTAKL